MLRSPFLNKQNFIRQHRCISYKQHAPVKMNNNVEEEHGCVPRKLMHPTESFWQLDLRFSWVTYMFMTQQKQTQSDAQSIQCSHDALGLQRMQLKTLLWQCPSDMQCTFSKKWCISGQMMFIRQKKKTGLWINEFKPHESFDHFMLLVMRAYIMRTQYGRKNSLFQQTFWCCAWTQTSNISRSFHTECLVWRKLLALF